MVAVDIWTEGPADRKWLADILKVWYHYSSETAADEHIIQLRKGTDTVSVVTIRSGKGVESFISGKAWRNMEENFKENETKGIKNLVVIDADEDFEQRRKQVFDTCGGYVTAETLYLWPENKTIEGKGDLEVLLKKVINEENSAFFECWNAQNDCLRTRKNQHHPEGTFFTPDRKAELYAYISAFTGDPRAANESKRDYTDQRFWNISPENPALAPLKSFFDQHLTAN